MLYEYPDEFIVEVMYMDILEEKKNTDFKTNNSYNSLFSNDFKKENLINTELLFRTGEKIKKKSNKKNIKRNQEEENLLEENRDLSDNIFDEFINYGLITKADVKKILIDTSFFDELDNDYAVSEMKEK